MRASWSRVAICAALLALSGCQSNGFRKFYQGERCAKVPFAQVCNGPPSGARLIGASGFISAGGEDNRHALAAARALGADWVCWSAQYANTTSHTASIPITTPTQSSSYVTGYYGSTPYSGTVTSYGSQTNYYPVNYVNHWFIYKADFYRALSRDIAPAPAASKH